MKLYSNVEFSKILNNLKFFYFNFKAGDLVDVLINDEEGRFATLVVAVQAAELVETLQGGN
jgi:hypothetical protein